MFFPSRLRLNVSDRKNFFLLKSDSFVTFLLVCVRETLHVGKIWTGNHLIKIKQLFNIKLQTNLMTDCPWTHHHRQPFPNALSWYVQGPSKIWETKLTIRTFIFEGWFLFNTHLCLSIWIFTFFKNKVWSFKQKLDTFGLNVILTSFKPFNFGLTSLDNLFVVIVKK